MWKWLILKVKSLQSLDNLAYLESNVVVSFKERLIPGCLREAKLNWGRGSSLHKAAVLLCEVARVNGKKRSQVVLSGIVAIATLKDAYVVVQFYPWFNFYVPLFQTHYHTIPYPKPKANKN